MIARIILALKRRGHIVGFMGDGINDAPLLHTADVGISVMTATDVARDAARSFWEHRAWRRCTAASWKGAGHPGT
jgi:magnesium-transporting ATPase (P-type)